MKMFEFLAGIAILSPHYVTPNGYNLGADHDVIYAYSTDTPLSEEEVKQMKGLGWIQEDVGSDEDDEDNVPYDSEEGWAVYV